MQHWIRSVRDTARKTADDRVLTHAAALAFYTSLSLPPIVILLTLAIGAVGPDGAAFLESEARQLIGESGATLLNSVLERAGDRRLDLSISGLVGLLTLLFGATGVFGQLQGALNRVWDAEDGPGGGILHWVRTRLLSVAILGVLAFLMLVSLAGSALIGMTGLAEDARWVARALNQALSLVVMTLLFAAVFKFLPDARPKWKDIFGGALLTAALFGVGRWLIGVYLAKRGLGEAYGAAGSVVVVLFWVYFNAILVLVGAEWTAVRSRARRSGATGGSEPLRAPAGKAIST